MTAAMLMAGAAFAGQIAVATPSQAGNLPKVLKQDSTREFGVRPATIGFTGDGTGYVGKLYGSNSGHVSWTKWNRTRAHGVGTVWVKSCTPNCAAGAFTKTHGTVNLSHVKRGRFTKMVIRFKYQGSNFKDARSLRHIADYYRWI